MINLIYFFSTWTANFGVVPLFLLASFLVEPFVLDFLFLIALVLFVFDTISYLPKIIANFQNRFNYLLSLNHLVKRIFLGILSFGILHVSNASEVSNEETRSVIMAIGEYQEISLPQLNQFTVGNKKIVATSLKNSGQKLLLKGKALGHSEILCWQKEKTTRLQVYVISKQRYLKYVELAKIVTEEIGITPIISANGVKITGEISLIEQYKKLISIITKYSEIIDPDLNIDPSLASTLIAQIYLKFYQQNIYEIKCSPDQIYILCDLPSSIKLETDFLKQLQSNFLIKVTTNDSRRGTNYKVKLHLVALESAQGTTTDLGGASLNAKVSEILNHNPSALFENNSISLNSQNITSKTIATPETIIAADTNGSLRVGSEMAIHGKQNEQEIISWKFAGLGLNFKIRPSGDLIDFEYLLTLTSPTSTGDVVGNKKRSRLYLNAMKKELLFNIQMSSTQKQSSSISSILAFLGATNSLQSNINLVGVIEIEPYQLKL